MDIRTHDDVLVYHVVSHLPEAVRERCRLLEALLAKVPNEYPRRTELARLLDSNKQAIAAQYEFQLPTLE